MSSRPFSGAASGPLPRVTKYKETRPGNVRELAAWVERLYATGLEPEVLVEMLLVEAESPREAVLPEGLSLRQLERRAIAQAMEVTDSNQRKAARLLQVHRATLARKLKKHKLT